MGAVLLGVVKGNALLQVLSGWDQLSKPAQADSQCTVGLQEEIRILWTLGQGEKLLRQLVCRLMLRSHRIKHKQSPQHREELRSLAYLLAQLPCPSIGLFYFRGRIALSSN